MNNMVGVQKLTTQVTSVKCAIVLLLYYFKRGSKCVSSSRLQRDRRTQFFPTNQSFDRKVSESLPHSLTKQIHHITTMCFCMRPHLLTLSPLQSTTRGL